MTTLIRYRTWKGPRTQVTRYLDQTLYCHLVETEVAEEVLQNVHLPGRLTIAEIVAERDRGLDREIRTIERRRKKLLKEVISPVTNVHVLRRKR